MRNASRLLLLILLTAVLSGCAFRTAISQGNLVDQKDVEQLTVGMTRNQVRFLLGTPMIDDPFHQDRWDYVYYLTIGRKSARVKQWVSVIFEDGLVAEIREDQDLNPEL